MFRFLFLCALCLFITTPSPAAWTNIQPNEFRMAPPPKPGSDPYKKDFQELHRWEKERKDSQCDFAAAQRFPTLEAFYGSSTGLLTEKEYSKAEDLLERVFKFSDKISSFFKRQYRRERPYDADETLTPCIDKPGGSTSYPSGHATLAAVGACVLAEIYPDKADTLKKKGAYYGQLRFIVGVHHPSDVAAGQKLGADICSRLLSEEDFVQEMPGR
jgi:acid phosphatase (class A)